MPCQIEIIGFNKREGNATFNIPLTISGGSSQGDIQENSLRAMKQMNQLKQKQ